MRSFITLVRNAYGGLPRAVWLLALAQLINRSGTMVVFFLAVYLSENLHFSLSRTGIVMGCAGLGSLLGVYVGGRLTDRIGYFPVMVGSLFAGSIMMFITGQQHNFYVMCLMFFLLNALGDAFRPANMVAVSHYSTPETYTRSVSLNRLAINLGFAFGPALGGLLVPYGYNLIFIADGITCLGAAAVVYFLLENRHHSAVAQRTVSEKHATGIIENSGSAYKDRIYIVFLFLSALYAIAFVQFFTTMPLYYTNVERFDAPRIGLLMGLNGLLVAGIEMIMIYKIEKKMTMYNFIALGSLLVLLSYISLLFLGGYAWMITITVIISFSEMFAMPFMNTFMNSRSVAANKGQYAALYVMSWSAGQSLTPIIATQVIEKAGYTALWIVMAAFSLIICVGIKWLEKIISTRST
jgi:predicted MFS family arabinose efflux permease